MKKKKKKYIAVTTPKSENKIEKGQKIGLPVHKKNVSYDVNAFKDHINNKTPRLLEICKDLRIGKDTLVEFLSSKQFSISSNPGAKLTFEMYVEALKEFDPEKLKGFEIPDSEISDDSYLVLSYANGKFVIKQQSSNGTVILSDGISTTNGLFFPYFTSTTAAITELEDLINTPNISEDELQKFLEKHPELILEDDYENAIPQARIVTENDSWEADFVLVPFNQNNFCKIVELKLPEEKTEMKPKNGHLHIGHKLVAALQQIRDYHDAFYNDDTRNRFRERYGKNVYRPDLQLIIGRKGDFQLKRNYLDLQKKENVKIMDWDSFLAKQKRKFN